MQRTSAYSENSRETDEGWRAIVEASPVGIYLVQNHKFVYVNQALAEMLGYRREEFVGRLGPLDVVHPEDRDLVARMMRERLSGRTEVVRYTVRGIHKDGRVVYAEVFGRRIRFRGRLALLDTVVDLTEKMRLLESLRESERSRRAILDAAWDAIITVNCRAEIIEWNKGAERLFGYKADEVRGKSLLIIIPPRYQRAFQRGFARALETGEHPHVGHLKEVPGRRKDGSEFPVEISLSLWQTREGPHFVAVARDITERKESLLRWRRSLKELARALSAALEARDPYTARHQLRVAELAQAIAEELGLPTDRVEGIYIGALLHDIGKLAVPTEILSKPTKLTPAERSLVKHHAAAGYEILKEVEFPWPVAEMVLQHHERLDGSGYPHGLEGDRITMEARILAVADVVEAMASHRPYRAALGVEAALEEIRKGRGTLYDPAVVDACLRLFREKGFRFSSQYEV